MSKTIAVGIGSRANYSSIKSFCLAIQSDKSFDLRVFVYSSAASKHYGDLEKEIRQDGLAIAAASAINIKGLVFIDSN